MCTLINDRRLTPPEKSMARLLLNTLSILILGLALGVLSKYLDTTASNTLPFIFEYLDLRNFLGRFAFWLVLALSISIYSYSPRRAALNVLIFFGGMLTSYYMYSYFIAGFYPRHYAMIWLIFTAISPLLASICWYAKGSSRLAFVLASGIIAVLFNTTFIYGWLYFEARSLLELLMFIIGVFVLRRQHNNGTLIMLITAILLAVILNLFLPFNFG